MVMKIVNVVAAIIKKNNKVFICQRGHGEYKGKWEFPGGKVEVGETLEEAVVREIREELKSEVIVERFFDEINENRGDSLLNVKFFICSLISGDLELTEHLASKWAEPSEINESDFMEADKPILDKLKNSPIMIKNRERKLGIANGKYDIDYEEFDKLDEYIAKIFDLDKGDE